MKAPIRLLNYPEIEPPFAWWLDAGYRGGVEKRVGWWGFNGYWYVIVFRDGTRTRPLWGTNNAEGKPNVKET